MTRVRKGLLAGPSREVVYIFERKGSRGGGYWWLVLECGHAVIRRRVVARNWSAQVLLIRRPVEEMCAPHRVQCHYCGSGSPATDPVISIRAFGGEV